MPQTIQKEKFFDPRKPFQSQRPETHEEWQARMGGEVLAVSPKAPMDKPLLQKLLKDNPAGNGHEMTPFVLMREKKG